MSPTEFWLRLMAISTLYGEKTLQAAHYYKLMPENPAAALRLACLTCHQQKQFFAFPDTQVTASLLWLEAPDQHLLTADDSRFPPPLRAIADFPAALLVKGDVALLSETQLAVVGSRNHSWYGARWGQHFCETLAALGLPLTSGLAAGVDGIAHRGALAVGGRTLAIMGNGLHHVYPARHQSLAQQIVAQGGALVSEFPLHCGPRPHHFPRRNRIISGLSRGVLVVEATMRSGSLVTARCALEQGREVFALPGPIGNPCCEGTNWLIKEGAVPVTVPQDIVTGLHQALPWLDEVKYSPDPAEPALPFPELLANVGDEVTPVDVVAERAGQPVPLTVAQLLELELAGWIAAVPGGYVRLRRAGHVRRTNVSV